MAWRDEAVGAALSGAVIIAHLIGDDRAQAGDIVARSRSPVLALCRALLAAGANPNSKLECFRGSVLALTVKTIGIGAKLTIKENDWVGPKVVPYEPLSRDRVGRHARQNGERVDDHPTTSALAGECGAGGITDISDGPVAGDRARRPLHHLHTAQQTTNAGTAGQ
jgi:hypothetical protein